MGTDTSGPPERPDESPSQRVTERRWLPVILVAAVILGVTGGAHAVADATAGAAAPPVPVGAGVRIQPVAGWDLEDQTAQPPFVRFHRGPVLLDVLALAPDPSGPSSLAARYVAEVLRSRLASVSVGEAAATTIGGGVAAVRFGYWAVTPQGVPLEGVVTVAAGPSAAAVFDAYAPFGELASVADDLRTMIDTASVG